MNGILLKGINDIVYTEIDKPIAGNKEVIVKVMASGICGSDINRVYKDGAHNMPLVIGHEFSGVVESVGEDVDEKWIGERVLVFPLIPCKKCPQCQKRKYEMCENYNYLGSRCNGGMAEYVSVPIWNIRKMPDNVSFEQAAMMEPMAVAAHVMRKVAIKEEDNVVVSGLGTIGCLLTMLLIDRGIKNLYVIGNKDTQKNAMITLGLDENRFCDIRQQDTYEYLQEKTNGKGADVVFECVGNNGSINTALKIIAPDGRICFVGNPHSDIKLDMDKYWQILRKQVTIYGTWNSSYYGNDQLGDKESITNEINSDTYMDDWQYCTERLSAGKIHPEKLISHKYPLNSLIEGLEIMRDKKEEYIKIMGVVK